MHKLAIFAAVAMMLPVAANAQTAPTSAAPTTGAKYTTADTELGTLLDDPAAKAVLEKYIPAMINNDQITMARGMTLKGLQQYAAEQLPDTKLAAIDADLAKISAKK